MGVCMNDDIEILRKEIIDPEDGSVDPEASAALDRLEAELNEAKESRDQHFAGRQHNAREVERLQEEKRVLAESETWALAEVERLRAMLDRQTRRLEVRTAEHEQARAELTEAKDWRVRALDLEAEVERLRDQKRSSDSTLAQTIDEVKRLRALAEQYLEEKRWAEAETDEMYDIAAKRTRELDESRAEVKGLRADTQELIVAARRAAQERYGVEYLRAALKPFEEEA